ncbi:MAG: hypothetical protein BGO09_04995 [Bacteroidetes bacterium 47-18]|nr:MAG: hypothetical protein BGO09_04995 [Bacteroidetes bacterium 47-18]
MKKNNAILCFVLTLITMLTLVATSCQKNEIENKKTLKKLYKIYKDGSISECKYNGQTVYTGMHNAFDAGMTIFDKDGQRMGTCNYAWGPADPICDQLTDCKKIYMVKDNLWGEPAVDKYRIGGLF